MAGGPISTSPRSRRTPTASSIWSTCAPAESTSWCRVASPARRSIQCRDDLSALLRFRQRSDAGAEVVDQVAYLAGGRDHAGHRGVRQHELQKDLRPAVRAEV